MRDRKPTDLRYPETERLRDDLLKDQWMWNYSWRGVKLAYLEKAYGVPPAEILSIMRDIAHKYDPPNADKLPDSRCTSCGMRIIWGKQNEKGASAGPENFERPHGARQTRARQRIPFRFLPEREGAS